MAKPTKHTVKHARSHHAVKVDEEPEPEKVFDLEESETEPESEELFEKVPEPAPKVLIPPPPPPSAEEALAAAEAIIRNLSTQTSARLGTMHGNELINAAVRWLAQYAG